MKKWLCIRTSLSFFIDFLWLIIAFPSLNSSEPRSEEFNDGNAMISHKNAMIGELFNDHWINDHGDGWKGNDRGTFFFPLLLCAISLSSVFQWSLNLLLMIIEKMTVYTAIVFLLMMSHHWKNDAMIIELMTVEKPL